MCRGFVDLGDRDLVQAELLAERLRIPQHIARTKLHRSAMALLAGQLDDCELLLADYEGFCAREQVGGSAAGAGGVRQGAGPVGGAR